MLAIPQRRMGVRRSSIRPVQHSLLCCVALFLLLVIMKSDDIGNSSGVDSLLIVKPQRAVEPIIQIRPEPPSKVEPVEHQGSIIQIRPEPPSKAEPVEHQEVPATLVHNTDADASLSQTPLQSILARYKVGPESLRHPPDYGNALYDGEADRMREGISASTRDKVDASLLLMSRRGHRTRVTHLIGGEHLEPSSHRDKLARAPVFVSDPLRSKLEAISDRDFDHQPISIQRECSSPVPCHIGGPTDGFAKQMTMENVECGQVNNPLTYCGNTKLASDVPLPYISYHDFGILKPVSSERRLILAAAYISNCGFPKRNHMVSSLVALTDHRVKSFGRCVPSNDREPDGGGTGQTKKLAVLQICKFSLAFENSETDDYVTEKFFLSLCAGAVPVVIGAPNVKFWAPDTTPYPYQSNALLHTIDFGENPRAIADLLMELDKNDAAYQELLAWKKKGYSDDYKALVDIGDVHSSCRLCTLAADDLRRVKGINKYDVKTLKDFLKPSHQFVLFVRERGTYSFTRVGFQSKPTMKELVKTTLEFIPMKEKNIWVDNQDLRGQPIPRIYAFYVPRPLRAAVLTDADVTVLPNGAELEVIMI